MPLFKPSVGQFPTPTITADSYVIPLLQPDRWFEEAAEGELAVDVYETDDQFVVQSTLAGVRPEDLALSLQRDLLTIRGVRHQPWPEGLTQSNQRSCLTRECYWGTFSRSILLPEPIDVPRATAQLKQGVLTIILPKLIERTHIDVSEIA
ncbi:MAG: Hsp20/alpha crystallin family protein [bacterium]|nr:Hsp20/alpha crystallin family protein [bacterium]